MGKIIVLDELTSNQIAAGEVVERPASVAKEMIENSMDAGATSITVEIENGGISFLRVTDNGSGIERDDMELAFERHATSKIRSAEDLKTINSFGFRGEALASVASVAEVEMVSRQKGQDVGNKLVVRGGNVVDKMEIGCNQGTIMTVRDLFYNTPVRYKFLKKDYTEAGYVEDVVGKMALIHSDIAFKFVNSKKTVIQTSGDGNIVNCIYSIYGKEIAKSVIPFDMQFENVRISGVAGTADTARANRANQIFFVNGRYIKNKTMSSAVENAYQTIAPPGRFPFVVVNIEMSSEFVDVNVHPTKTEVRFSDESLVYRATYNAIRSTVLNKDLIPEDEEKEQTEAPKHDVSELFSAYKKVESYDTRPTNSLYKKPIVSYVPVNKPSSPIIPSRPLTFRENSEIDKTPIKERNESLFTSELVAPTVVKNYKIIGSVFSTFILIQQNDDFYIIDQHAAHERVLYEKLVKKIHNSQKIKQMLMVPEILEVKNNELQIIKDNMDLFDKVGFEIEEFGGNSIKISAVPSEVTGIAIKELFYDLIDSLQKESGVKENDRVEYFIFTMACKAAVKANMNLDPREIESLMDQMMKLENPFTCPHGRPTAIKMTKGELEKKFKRTGF